MVVIIQHLVIEQTMKKHRKKLELLMKKQLVSEPIKLEQPIQHQLIEMTRMNYRMKHQLKEQLVVGLKMKINQMMNLTLVLLVIENSMMLLMEGIMELQK